MRLVGAVLLGATAVGVLWLVLSGGGSSATASFQVSPGISPVVFPYLDNGQIASYLAQLQGGAATTEQLSRQATVSKNASVGANGVGVGGSASQESTAELSLTVTNQSRFTSLLDLLQADGFLHTIDTGASDHVVSREFAAVPAGTFVKLTYCTLTLPTYVQDEERWRAARGHVQVATVYGGEGDLSTENSAFYAALADRTRAEGKRWRNLGLPLVPEGAHPRNVRLARVEMNRLVRRVGTNPRVPLSSCSPSGYDPRKPDLLMPIRLGTFTANQTALSGPVTVVAKVMLRVRRVGKPYVDLASLQQWAGASIWTGNLPNGIGKTELMDDATVLAPGYVLQPIAIYK